MRSILDCLVAADTRQERTKSHVAIEAERANGRLEYYNILRWQRDPKTAVVDRLLKESSKRHYEYPLGAFLCHATNKNTNGIVIAAVAMSTGWNAVGLISRPARCIKGIGNTVNSQ